MPDTFEYDRHFDFAVSPEVFWATVSRTESYRRGGLGCADFRATAYMTARTPSA